MSLNPFNPSGTGTFVIANATSASTPIFLTGGDQVVLYNSSSSATAFVLIRPTPSVSDTITGNVATAPVVGTPGSFPIPPGAQIRISCAHNHKSISAIASAADGNLYVTPGHGN